jgi:putative ABC transport system substrate-binding protein
MRRRAFGRTFIGGMAASVACPSLSNAQPRTRPLIAWLGSGPERSASRYIVFLREGLKELGYLDGQDIDIVARLAEGYVERLPALAGEIVALKPAIIVAGAVDAAIAANKVTTTIPIVSGALADAENLGLANSFSHPGHNVTGVTPYIDNLPAKQMELAREVVPGAAKVGLLGNWNDPKAQHARQELEQVGHKLQVAIVAPDVRGPNDIDNAVATLTSDKVDAVIVMQTAMNLGERQKIAALFATRRIPAVYGYREHVDAGGLISYGVDLAWCWHRVATFVAKILKGAAPGDLPLEFPPKLQMVVNLKAAKALGLTLPPSILARADEVIE